MNWLNEVQLFRKGLHYIKEALNHMLVTNPCYNSRKEVQKFYSDIREVGAELEATEEKILRSLNNGKMYWRGSYQELSSSGKHNSDGSELFDLMKNNYTTLIELQRSINSFLSAQS